MPKRLLLLILIVGLALPVALLVLDRGPETDAGPGADLEAAGGGATAPASPRELARADDASTPIAGAPVESRATSGERAPAGPTNRTSAAPQERERPKVMGRVIDPDGRPVPGATVEMKRPGEALLALAGLESKRTEKGETDAQGRFALPGAAGELVSFTVEAPGFLEFEQADLTCPEDLNVPLEDFVLEPGLVLWGRVTDPTGRPIEGAELELGWSFFRVGGDESDPDAVSDAEGRFELPAVEPGSWSVSVRADGHPLRIYQGDDAEAGRLEPPLDVELPIGRSISGTVSGVPAAKLDVLRVRASSVEDTGRSFFRSAGPDLSEIAADGSFEIPNLDPALLYDVTIVGGTDPSALFFGGGRGTGERANTVQVPAGTEGVELAYRLGGTLSFQAVDAGTREPVEDFVAEIGQLLQRITIEEPSGAPRTHHEGGRGVFHDLHAMAVPIGDGPTGWTLTVDAPGYVPARKEAIAVPETGELDLGTIELVPAPKLTLRVVDAGTGKPVRAAQVVLSVMQFEDEDDEDFGFVFGKLMAEPSRRARTDREGVCVLESYGERPCSVRVSKARYATHTEEALVVGQKDSELEIRLAAEGEVTVRLLDGDGRPMGGRTIEHMAPGEVEASGNDETRSDGTARFRKLIAGEHAFRYIRDRVRWDDEEGSEPWTSVTVSPGAELEVLLRGPKFAEVSGTVTAGGSPVEGAQVRLHALAEDATVQAAQLASDPDNWWAPEDTTDASGAFTLEEVEYGEYFLTVETDGREQAWVQRAGVDGPRERVEVRLVDASVEGRVTDREGRPLAGVQVRARTASSGTGGNWWREDTPFWRGGGGGPTTVVRRESSGTAEQSGTDAQGRFRLDGLATDVELVVDAGGDLVRPGSSEAFTLAPGELRTGLVLALAAAGAVDLTITRAPDWSGMPLTQVTLSPIEVEDEDAGSVSETQWGRDVFSIGGLSPGKWRVEARSGGSGWNVDMEQPPDHQGTVIVRAGQRTAHDVIFD